MFTYLDVAKAYIMLEGFKDAPFKVKLLMLSLYPIMLLLFLILIINYFYYTRIKRY